MRPWLLFTLCILPTLTLAQVPVKYTISFENRDHHEAEVRIMFEEVHQQVLQLRMSRTSPGRYALHEFAKNVYNVAAHDSRGKPLRIERSNPHQWNVTGHDGRVEVTYTIFGDRCDGTYLAIDNRHAHINIPATFMWARQLQDRPVEVTFVIPADWRIATQLAPTDAPKIYMAPNLQYFMDSPVEISDFDLREWSVADNGNRYTIRLALHHDGSEAETDAYAALCEKVVQEQIALFGEPPKFDYGAYTFIVDYLPFVDGDGMEHRNSTVCTAPRSLREHAVRNLGTIAHEFFHSWNVERIRPQSLEPFDFERANMSGELWFAEGFTSYYDDLTLKRAQLISLDRYAEALTRTLNEVLHSPARRYFSLTEMSMRAPFTDAATSVDPTNLTNTFISYYPYGAAIALALDLSLRQQFDGATLDDFMRRVWQEHGVSEQPYTIEDLRLLLGKTTGDTDFANDFFSRFITGHELPHFAALLNPAGMLVRKAHPDEAWLGVAELHFEDDKIILDSATRIGSPLYQAGLDHGDVILQLAGETLGNQAELKDFVKAHKPGDTVKIVMEKNGIEQETELTLQENPEIEVVPLEHTGQAVTDNVLAFRKAWLGSRAQFTGDELQRHCPRCRRSYPFRFEYCRYDGAELGLTEETEF